MNASIRLLSHTAHPVETLYLEWEQSRGDEPIPEAWVIAENRKVDPAFAEKLDKLFEQMLLGGLPVLETIDLVFLVEGCSIALREQIVRHRIGHKFGQEIGADIIPELQSSSFWSQSMRVKNMGSFWENDEYYTPPTIEDNDLAQRLYEQTIQSLQITYNELVALGVPVEDARNVIPLAATHRMIWRTNLSAVVHILKKRGCWIAQLGIWKPLIQGMVKELCDKIHPLCATLITPPCINKNKWAGCPFPTDNQARWMGDDPGIPCVLWAHMDMHTVPDGTKQHPEQWCLHAEGIEHDNKPELTEASRKMQKEYEVLWRRNPLTGDLILKQTGSSQ